MSSAAPPSTIDEFAGALAHVLPRINVLRDDLARYAVDGALPEVAVEPADEGGVAAALAEAHARRLAVIPVAGGAHLGHGNAPAAYDVALSLRRLDRIIAHEPADLTVTVEPAVPLTRLQAHLAGRGQFLPLDPPAPESATIGGIVAVNAFGPLRHAYGAARDWLLGVRAVHADGSISKAGGRVVKNVAGYEMTKLYVGSLGTLAVITEMTFKAAPLPATEAAAAIETDSAAAACDVALAARDAGLALAAAEVLSPSAAHAVVGDARWTALLRLSGSAGAIERSLRELRAISSSTHAMLRAVDVATTWRAWSEAFAPQALSLRCAVLPSQVAGTIEVLDRRFVGAQALLSACVGAGVVRARLDPARGPRPATLVGSAADVAARRAGALVVDAAPPTLKREIDVFGVLRPDFAIMRRLKEEFDERCVLSPGRFAGRL